MQEQTPRVDLPENPHKKLKFKVLKQENILNKQRNILAFTGKFLDSFGQPEKHSKWFITGPSFSGKSTLVFFLSNYLSKFGEVDYNNHEEAGGDSQTVADKIRLTGKELNGKIRYYKAPIDSETHVSWLDHLLKKRSASFAILDSLQHAELNRKQYLLITEKLCNTRRSKCLLFISHWVKNDFTKFIKHDCDVKIEVIGFVAYVESRYGGNKPFVIWEEGAKKYWRKNYHSVISGKYWPGKKK